MLTPGMEIETTYTDGRNIRGTIRSVHRFSVLITVEKVNQSDPNEKDIVTGHHERWIRPVSSSGRGATK